MSFFDSEIVQKEIEYINTLQEKVKKGIYKFSNMNEDQQYNHIDLLYELLDKQQILYFRLSLSDDPDALNMKEHIEKHSRQLGFIQKDMRDVFKAMKESIEDLREII